jgi:hypothetical protein
MHPPYYQPPPNESSNFLNFFYLLIITLIIFICIFSYKYIQSYIKDLKEKNINTISELKALKKNNSQPSKIKNKEKPKIKKDNFSKKKCKDYTKLINIDEHKPELAGLDCIYKYIIKNGEKTSKHSMIVKWLSTNKTKYLLDTQKKQIDFFDEDGIPLLNKICMYNKKKFCKVE